MPIIDGFNPPVAPQQGDAVPLSSTSPPRQRRGRKPRILAHSPDNPAFEGLSPATIRAITHKATVAMVHDLVSCLTSQPQYVAQVIIKMAQFPWFRRHTKRESQIRALRNVYYKANWEGFPVCSGTEGIFLATKQQLLEAAGTAERSAAGKLERAKLYRRAAGLMP